VVIWPLLIGSSEQGFSDARARGERGGGAKHRIGQLRVSSDKVAIRLEKLLAELVALPKWAVRWTKLAVNKPLQIV